MTMIVGKSEFQKQILIYQMKFLLHNYKIIFLEGMNMFKVDNKVTRTTCEVFLVYLLILQIVCTFFLFLMFILGKYLFAGEWAIYKKMKKRMWFLNVLFQLL